ncbi:MAG: MASE3 domain-containing protein [Synergistota bacterium]|nr:MASE3 domain-containing protein [Synergistota bacterium]
MKDYLNDHDNWTGFFSLERLMAMLVASVVLWIVSRSNYLLFRVTVEGFSIVVACLIFVLASKTWRFSKNNFLLYLGNAYIAIALIDFFHTLTFKGMAIFTSHGASTSTQLWVAARFLEAFVLFSAPWLADRFPRRIQAPACWLNSPI